jgi:hypothetical protein
MMLLLFPEINQKIKNTDSEFRELLLWYDRIAVPFFDIYSENNAEKRHEFFKNKLIQWLWNYLFFKNYP